MGKLRIERMLVQPVGLKLLLLTNMKTIAANHFWSMHSLDICPGKFLFSALGEWEWTDPDTPLEIARDVSKVTSHLEPEKSPLNKLS